MQNDASTIFLCKACGIVSRGKFILQKLEQSEDFSCAMGKEGKFYNYIFLSNLADKFFVATLIQVNKCKTLTWLNRVLVSSSGVI
jgi:aspartate/methionine/tyrosine aminotransferase